MTQNSLKLSVSKPCTENWATMTPHAQGKHCLACQKTVVDFTTMSDAQIIHYFNNYQGKTCGRFMESQLQRPILLPSSSKNQMRWAWLFSILLLPVSAKTQTPQYNVDFVEKKVTNTEQTEKTTQKPKASKKHKKQKDEAFKFDSLTDITMGFTSLQEPPLVPLKSSEEILKGLFNSFKNLITSILSFLVRL